MLEANTNNLIGYEDINNYFVQYPELNDSLNLNTIKLKVGEKLTNSLYTENFDKFLSDISEILKSLPAAAKNEAILVYRTPFLPLTVVEEDLQDVTFTDSGFFELVGKGSNILNLSDNLSKIDIDLNLLNSQIGTANQALVNTFNALNLATGENRKHLELNLKVQEKQIHSLNAQLNELKAKRMNLIKTTFNTNVFFEGDSNNLVNPSKLNEGLNNPTSQCYKHEYNAKTGESTLSITMSNSGEYFPREGRITYKDGTTSIIPADLWQPAPEGYESELILKIKLPASAKSVEWAWEYGYSFVFYYAQKDYCDGWDTKGEYGYYRDVTWEPPTPPSISIFIPSITS